METKNNKFEEHLSQEQIQKDGKFLAQINNLNMQELSIYCTSSV